MLSSDNLKYGYNAATGKYEDLMAAGIIDPTKVACCFCLYCQNNNNKNLICDKLPSHVLSGSKP